MDGLFPSQKFCPPWVTSGEDELSEGVDESGGRRVGVGCGEGVSCGVCGGRGSVG